jgi:hypothetical protein
MIIIFYKIFCSNNTQILDKIWHLKSLQWIFKTQAFVCVKVKGM